MYLPYEAAVTMTHSRCNTFVRHRLKLSNCSDKNVGGHCKSSQINKKLL